MENQRRNQLKTAVSEMITTTAIWLPDDVEQALRGMEQREEDPRAKAMYGCILENIQDADALHRPLCQDTGNLQFFLDVGTDFPFLGDLEDILREAAMEATEKTPLRPNVVEPLGEKNTGNNVGYGLPSVEYDLIPHSSDLRIRLYLAGGGCSLPGRSKVLMPLEGIRGIKDFIYRTVVEWGVNACPPLCIGIGLGTCAVSSAILSKRALLRPLGTRHQNPEIAKLEAEIRDDLNEIGIAPFGLGGSESVLGVNIECAGHHPATLGVGLSTSCWALRRGEILIHEDLTCQMISHRRLTGGR